MTSSKLAPPARAWFGPEDCRLEDFRAVVEQTTDPADYPYEDSVEQGVLVYGAGFSEHAVSAEHRAGSSPKARRPNSSAASPAVTSSCCSPGHRRSPRQPP